MNNDKGREIAGVIEHVVTMFNLFGLEVVPTTVYNSNPNGSLKHGYKLKLSAETKNRDMWTTLIDKTTMFNTPYDAMYNAVQMFYGDTLPQ